jgi:two-component SAPR family response regulator
MIMSNLERDNLIDGFFNKGYACDLNDVYQSVMGTIKDLEKANDEKVEKIERLNNIINEMENYINYNLDYWNKESSQRSSYIRETLTNTLDTLRKLKGKNND